MSDFVVAHISDIHFGGRADFPQVAALEKFLPSLGPQVIAVSGDLTQRARHGEFQAARLFLDDLARLAPVHLVPGNHDVQWWRSPFGILGYRAKYSKWRRYFGEDLTPTLELDGVIVAGMCSAHGVAFGSLTPNLNDIAVIGHLPASEVERVRRIFAGVPPDKLRIVALHHNVIPGPISHRWGLARPRAAQQALVSLDADLVLCGHDHTEAAGEIAGRLPVSTAGTHSIRTRGGRPSAFNLIRIGPEQVQIVHYLYARDASTFRRGDTFAFSRRRATASLGR